MGIYEGTSRGLQTSSVIETCCNIRELFRIVESMHVQSAMKGIFIKTDTYVISNKLSTNLYSSLVFPSVPHATLSIINTYLYKDMGVDVCRSIRLLDSEQQEKIVGFYIRANRQHGRIKQMLKAVEQADIKERYLFILEQIARTRSEVIKYLISGNNAMEVMSIYLSLFRLYDLCIQKTLRDLMGKHFKGDYNTLMGGVSDEHKPKSPKNDLSRLTFSERSNFIRGIMLTKPETRLPFTENDIITKSEYLKMIDYRNKLDHQKVEEIEKIGIWELIDVVMWMIQMINHDFVLSIKLPKMASGQ